MASRPVRSDWDLRELEAKIADVELQRLRTPDFPPYMFDRFEALCTVRGGMGLVIKARDPQLDRLVAIKLGVRSDGPAQADVIAEAKTLAQLRHENVVMVYDLGVWNDRVYFVMEWIEGVDGHDWMSRQRSWREVRRVFVNAGTGLAAAHDADIHHRDFKPSNILIGRDGRVVVAAFGLAASLHTSPGSEEAGGRAETACYMAPEQLCGKRGDARSDQFSFCVAMWQALFQQRPFDERGEIRETPLVDVPRWLVEVIRKGLAYDPDERHRDMRALLAAFLDEPQDDSVVTPATLLRGQLWAPWGPPIAERYLTDKVLRLVASRTGRSFGFVQDAIAHSQDRSRYLLIYRLSRTGHAVVYEAVDRRLGRDVAIKIHRDARQHAIEKKLFDSQSPGRMAIAESQVMSQLEHSNVVRLLDVGEHGPWLFSVIELCDEHLGNWSASLGWQKNLARIIEAANGLAYLHELGYAHGDIKPRNILIKNGAAKLADFGHATRIRGSRLWFRRCGTAGYIAPEVHDGGAGVEGDVFALAVTLWYCLFRELPYPYTKGREFDEIVEESVQRAIDKNIKPPENIPEGLPRSVFRLLERALDPDPVIRPTVGEFIARLRAILEQDERRLERRRRVPRVAASVAVILALGFSLGAARYRGSGHGSVVLTAVRAEGPIALAELAANAGDGEVVVAELNRLDPIARDMSVGELDRLISRMEHIAVVLETSSPEHTEVVRFFADRFRRMRRER